MTGLCSRTQTRTWRKRHQHTYFPFEVKDAYISSDVSLCKVPIRRIRTACRMSDWSTCPFRESAQSPKRGVGAIIPLLAGHKEAVGLLGASPRLPRLYQPDTRTQLFIEFPIVTFATRTVAIRPGGENWCRAVVKSWRQRTALPKQVLLVA